MLEQYGRGGGSRERVLEEEEAGWGTWCAWAEPDPDAGTDVLAWPGRGWGHPDPRGAGSSELSPLPAVGRCPEDLLPPSPAPHTSPVHPPYKPVPQLWPSHLGQSVPCRRPQCSSSSPQQAATPLSLPKQGAERGHLMFTGFVAVTFPGA